VRAEVAIVGNGVAGYACAARLARHGIHSLLIGPGLPVDRPPLTKNALAAGAVRLLADETRLAELGIDRLDAMVDTADLGAGTLAAGPTEVVAERIVLATGLSYRPPRIPGLEAAHVNATPRGMTRLAAALAGGPKRVAVIGAGLIGTETAATLAVAGHDVTALDLLERPLEAQARKVEADRRRRLVVHRARLRVRLGERAAHPELVRALPGEEEREPRHARSPDHVMYAEPQVIPPPTALISTRIPGRSRPSSSASASPSGIDAADVFPYRSMFRKTFSCGSPRFFAAWSMIRWFAW